MELVTYVDMVREYFYLNHTMKEFLNKFLIICCFIMQENSRLNFTYYFYTKDKLHVRVFMYISVYVTGIWSLVSFLQHPYFYKFIAIISGRA